MCYILEVRKEEARYLTQVKEKNSNDRSNHKREKKWHREGNEMLQIN